MAIRIKVQNAATKAVLNMELEPETTILDVVTRAASYWGKDPSSHVLRRERSILPSSLTLVEARLVDGDEIEFLTEEKAMKPLLVLESSTGRSLSIEDARVLGRSDLQSLVEDARDAPKISNRHLTIGYQTGIYTIEDGARGRTSRNGTSLNGMDLRGRGPSPIRDGDRLDIARVLSVTVRIVPGG